MIGFCEKMDTTVEICPVMRWWNVHTLDWIRWRPNHQYKCDSCWQNVFVHHALWCINGGLVITRQNEICHNIIHLDRKYYYPNCIHGEPLICQDHSIYEGDVCHGERISETWGVMLIWGVYESQLEVVIGIGFRDADAEIWKTEGMEKIFLRW